MSKIRQALRGIFPQNLKMILGPFDPITLERDFFENSHSISF